MLLIQGKPKASKYRCLLGIDRMLAEVLEILLDGLTWGNATERQKRL